MRVHGRLLLGMFGLAIAVPSVVVAAPFGDDAASMPVAGQPEAHAQASLIVTMGCLVDVIALSASALM